MASTPNLGLIVDHNEQTTTFGDYLSDMDGNLRTIDTFAGAIRSVSGSATLAAASWVGTTYTLTVQGLGNNDSIEFYPATESDQDKANAAGLFVAPATVGNTVTITARTTPTENISLVYKITRV